MSARDPIGFDTPPFCDEPGRPMADEPRSLIDSWPFLVCFGIVVAALVLARSQGWLS